MRDNNTISVGLELNLLDQQFANSLNSLARSLEDLDFGVDVDTTEAKKALNNLRQDISRLDNHSLKINANTREFTRQVNNTVANIPDVNMRVQGDFSNIRSQINEIRNDVDVDFNLNYNQRTFVELNDLINNTRTNFVSLQEYLNNNPITININDSNLRRLETRLNNIIDLQTRVNRNNNLPQNNNVNTRQVGTNNTTSANPFQNNQSFNSQVFSKAISEGVKTAIETTAKGLQKEVAPEGLETFIREVKQGFNTIVNSFTTTLAGEAAKIFSMPIKDFVTGFSEGMSSNLGKQFGEGLEIIFADVLKLNFRKLGEQSAEFILAGMGFVKKKTNWFEKFFNSLGEGVKTGFDASGNYLKGYIVNKLTNSLNNALDNAFNSIFQKRQTNISALPQATQTTQPTSPQNIRYSNVTFDNVVLNNVTINGLNNLGTQARNINFRTRPARSGTSQNVQTPFEPVVPPETVTVANDRTIITPPPRANAQNNSNNSQNNNQIPVVNSQESNQNKPEENDTQAAIKKAKDYAKAVRDVFSGISKTTVQGMDAALKEGDFVQVRKLYKDYKDNYEIAKKDILKSIDLLRSLGVSADELTKLQASTNSFLASKLRPITERFKKANRLEYSEDQKANVADEKIAKQELERLAPRFRLGNSKFTPKAVDTIQEGTKIVNDLVRGVGNQRTYNNFSLLGSQAALAYIKAMKDSFGIASPSKVMIGVGANIVQGLVEGVNKGLPNLAAATNQIKNTIVSPVTLATSQLNNIPTNIQQLAKESQGKTQATLPGQVLGTVMMATSGILPKNLQQPVRHLGGYYQGATDTMQLPNMLGEKAIYLALYQAMFNQAIKQNSLNIPADFNIPKVGVVSNAVSQTDPNIHYTLGGYQFSQTKKGGMRVDDVYDWTHDTNKITEFNLPLGLSKKIVGIFDKLPIITKLFGIEYDKQLEAYVKKNKQGETLFGFSSSKNNKGFLLGDAIHSYIGGRPYVQGYEADPKKFAEMREKARVAFNNAQGDPQKFFSSVMSGSENTKKSFRDIGVNLLSSFVNGLSSSQNPVFAFIGNFGKTVINTIKSIFGIASPSKVMQSIGLDFGKGFENGVVASLILANKRISEQMYNAVMNSQTATDAQKKIVTDHLATVTKTHQQIAEGYRTGKINTKEAVDQVTLSLQNTLVGARVYNVPVISQTLQQSRREVNAEQIAIRNAEAARQARKQLTPEQELAVKNAELARQERKKLSEQQEIAVRNAEAARQARQAFVQQNEANLRRVQTQVQLPNIPASPVIQPPRTIPSQVPLSLTIPVAKGVTGSPVLPNLPNTVVSSINYSQTNIRASGFTELNTNLVRSVETAQEEVNFKDAVKDFFKSIGQSLIDSRKRGNLTLGQFVQNAISAGTGSLFKNLGTTFFLPLITGFASKVLKMDIPSGITKIIPTMIFPLITKMLSGKGLDLGNIIVKMLKDNSAIKPGLLMDLFSSITGINLKTSGFSKPNRTANSQAEQMSKDQKDQEDRDRESARRQAEYNRKLAESRRKLGIKQEGDSTQNLIDSAVPNLINGILKNLGITGVKAGFINQVITKQLSTLTPELSKVINSMGAGQVKGLIDAYVKGDTRGITQQIIDFGKYNGLNLNLDPKKLESQVTMIMSSLTDLQVRFNKEGFALGNNIIKGFQDAQKRWANAADDMKYAAKKAMGTANLGDITGNIANRVKRQTEVSVGMFDEMYSQIGKIIRAKMFPKMDRRGQTEMMDNIGGMAFANAALFAPLATMAASFTPLIMPLLPIIQATRGLINVLSPYIGYLTEAVKRIEPLQRKLNFVGGGVSGGQQELDYVRKVSRQYNTPIEFGAEAYAQLAIAARGTKMAGAGVRELFEGISASMGALGLTGQDASLVFMAYTQILSKGKVSMEELRQQLGERFPPAMSVFAKALGVTIPELNSMIAKGSLLSEDVLPKVAKVLKAEFGGATASTNTFTGALTKMGNTTFDIAVEVTNGLGGMFAGITNFINFGLERIRDSVSTLIPIIRATLLTLFAMVGIGLATMLNMGPVATAIRTAQNLLLSTFKTAMVALAPMVLGTIIDFADTMIGAQNDMFDNMVTGTTNMITALLGVLENAKRMATGVPLFGDIIGKDKSNPFQGLIDGFKSLFKTLPSGLVELASITFMIESVYVLLRLPLATGLFTSFIGMLKGIAAGAVSLGRDLRGLSILFANTSQMNFGELIPVLNAREAAMNKLKAATLAVGSALTTVLTGLAFLSFAKGDFSDPLGPAVTKMANGVNDAIASMKTSLEDLATKFDKVGNSASDAGDKVKKLPSKGPELNLQYLLGLGGKSYKTDDLYEDINAKPESKRVENYFISRFNRLMTDPLGSLSIFGVFGDVKRAMYDQPNKQKEQILQAAKDAKTFGLENYITGNETALPINKAQLIGAFKDTRASVEGYRKELTKLGLTGEGENLFKNNPQLQQQVNVVKDIDARILKLGQERQKLAAQNSSDSIKAIGEMDKELIKLKADRDKQVKPLLQFQMASDESNKFVEEMKEAINNDRSIPLDVKIKLLSELQPLEDFARKAREIIERFLPIPMLEPNYQEANDALKESERIEKRLTNRARIVNSERLGKIYDSRLSANDTSNQMLVAQSDDLNNQFRIAEKSLTEKREALKILDSLPAPTQDERKKEIAELREQVTKGTVDLAALRTTIRKNNSDLRRAFVEATKQAQTIALTDTNIRELQGNLTIKNSIYNKEFSESAGQLMIDNNALTKIRDSISINQEAEKRLRKLIKTGKVSYQEAKARFDELRQEFLTLKQSESDTMLRIRNNELQFKNENLVRPAEAEISRLRTDKAQGKISGKEFNKKNLQAQLALTDKELLAVENKRKNAVGAAALAAIAAEEATIYEKRASAQEQYTNDELSRLQRAQQKGIDIVKLAGTERQQELQKLINAGLILEEDAKAEQLKIDKLALEEELKSEIEAQKVLESVRYKDPIKQEEHESRIRASKQKTATLVLQLLQNEKSQAEANYEAIKRAYDRVSQAITNKISKAELSINKEVKANEILTKQLERQSELLTAQKNLRTALTNYKSSINEIEKEGKDDISKAQADANFAQEKLNSVRESVRLERESLEIEIQRNNFAMRRLILENQIAVLKNKGQQAKAGMDYLALQQKAAQPGGGGVTPEQLEQARLEYAIAKAEGDGLKDIGVDLMQTQQSNETVNTMKRRTQQLEGATQINNAQLESARAQAAAGNTKPLEDLKKQQAFKAGFEDVAEYENAKRVYFLMQSGSRGLTPYEENLARRYGASLNADSIAPEANNKQSDKPGNNPLSNQQYGELSNAVGSKGVAGLAEYSRVNLENYNKVKTPQKPELTPQDKQSSLLSTGIDKMINLIDKKMSEPSKIQTTIPINNYYNGNDGQKIGDQTVKQIRSELYDLLRKVNEK